MADVLTDQDKLGIVQQHIRNKEYALYSSQMDHLEESSKALPNQAILASVGAVITDATAQLTALQNEQTRLTTSIATSTQGA